MSVPQMDTSLAAAPIQDSLVQALQSQIYQVETSSRLTGGVAVSSGNMALDGLLPGGGYSPGTLVQWLAPEGCGVDYLSLLGALEACRAGGALVVLDPWRQFYPPALAALGVDMGNLIILRPPQHSADQSPPASGANEMYWAIDQALRCDAVGAVWGPIGAIDERWFRRFQLSAESSGCLGMFVQSPQEARRPSWAEVQWVAAPAKTNLSQRTAGRVAATAKHRREEHFLSTADVDGDRLVDRGCWQRVRLKLARCRGAKTGRSIGVSINAVTGEVH